MPRPKKPGAPEPKSRSRRGCWPCKARKVKCDETNMHILDGPCLNCQRLNQLCDFRMRLNWEGRGKNIKQGTINFSSNSISVSTGSGPSPMPHLNESTVTKATSPIIKATLPQIETQQLSQPAFGSSLPLNNQSSLLPPRSPSDMESIDPVLTGFQFSPFPDGIYGGTGTLGLSHYTQSYERYREDGSNTPYPQAASVPAVSKLRQVQRRETTLSNPGSEADSPAASTYSSQSVTLQPSDSPLSTPAQYEGVDDLEAFQNDGFSRPAKRRRGNDSAQREASLDTSMPPPAQVAISSSKVEPFSAGSTSLLSNLANNSSNPHSPHSENGLRNFSPRPSPRTFQDSTEVRRLSVNSLLSGPPGIPTYRDGNGAPRSDPEIYQDMFADTVTYGVDRGIKDLDIPNNDDMNAITGASPISKRAHLALTTSPSSRLEFGFGMEESSSLIEAGSYYSQTVNISLPKILHPLSPKLLQNPMNLLYFHHFLNHTAGCLLPHNCASNPFRSILPIMAMQDEHLLNLLLAYSACHRSRTLCQPEPTTRIALWVQDIFSHLRKALDDPSQIITNSILATAIMLASLEIISPNAFGVIVPWQSHLETARQMILMRGGPKGMRTESRKDRVSSFLWSWFAYLDVLGSLSGGKNSPSSNWVLDYHVEGDTDYEIDCVLGFTSKCIRILAQIAALARVCDGERIRPDTEVVPGWSPSIETITRAAKLEADLEESRLAPSTPCTHMQSSGEAAYQWDSVEMSATNEAFHWAGHVHLQRRILGKPSAHPEVQNAVREIFGALYKVRRGSNAEGCLLFPMFTAGCDSQNEKQKADILDRMKGVEQLGMSQVHRARTLMERVWETGKPWETLVAGEFFG